MKALRWPAWLAAYDRGKALQDAVAGVVVTILLVPQSLAYAMLAGQIGRASCRERVL